MSEPDKQLSLEEVTAQLVEAKAAAEEAATKAAASDDLRMKAEEIASSLKTALAQAREKSQEKPQAAPTRLEKNADTDISDIVERVRAESAKDVLDEQIRAYGESDEERAAIRQAYSERKPSGYSMAAIEKDVKIAKATVHIDRLELRPGKSTDKSLTAAMAGGSGKPNNVAAEEITEKDREIAALVGMAPEKYAKYKKQLGHS